MDHTGGMLWEIGAELCFYPYLFLLPLHVTTEYSGCSADDEPRTRYMDDEVGIKFIPEGKDSEICFGAQIGLRHIGAIVYLPLLKSGRARRGVCKKCGLIILSLQPQRLEA